MLQTILSSVGRISNGQKGFTLIELLVVVVILGVLAVVVIPAVSRFAGAGDASANATELSNVQGAMDTMIAENQIAGVSPSPAVGTNVFNNWPNGPGAIPLYPNYLRRLGAPGNPTKCTYAWTAAGEVSQLSCP